jgi:hypothetical protein
MLFLSLNSFLRYFSLLAHRLRCIRSTPTEMQSIGENDFKCFEKTGVVKSPLNTMLSHANTRRPTVSNEPLAARFDRRLLTSRCVPRE